MISVDLAPEVQETLRAMANADDAPKRCHQGVITSAVAAAVARLLSDDLSGIVRPWHFDALRSRAEHLGDVTSARVVSACVLGPNRSRTRFSTAPRPIRPLFGG